MKIVAIVGMPGSGKSEVARVLEKEGFLRVRFGDLTDNEVKTRGLELNEANERAVREALRREHGMAAYAKLSLPAIEAAGKKGSVVIDGLYSWEEYLFLKQKYGDDFTVVAVWASPRTRYSRLGVRAVRKLTPAEAASRDHAEIQNMNKGGPIAMADFTIANEKDMGHLRQETARILAEMT